MTVCVGWVVHATIHVHLQSMFAQTCAHACISAVAGDATHLYLRWAELRGCVTGGISLSLLVCVVVRDE